MFLASISAILALLKSFEFIYVFQIKEYRFDRFDLFLKEEGIFRVLYATAPRWPARTARNYLIAALCVVLALPLFFLYSFYPLPTLALLTILSPFVGFLLISISVFITGAAAGFKRKNIIEAASRRIAASSAVFIGITGSYGKTSTKEFLYHVLSRRFKVAKTDENMNTDVGVGLSILKNLHKDTEFFIAEAGAYRVGEIAQIAHLIHPKHAILTAIGNQHVGLFGSRENLLKAKLELLEGLPATGTAYIHKDIPEFAEIVRNARYGVRSFSLNQKADITAEEVRFDGTTLSATIKYKKRVFEVKTKLLGAHTIHNLLPVVAIAFDLGMKKNEIEAAVTALAGIPSKLSLTKGTGGASVLLDSYNSSVEGFLAAQSTAEKLPQRKKIILSRGILELGEEKAGSYKKILTKLQKANMRLYTTDRLFKKLDRTGSVTFFASEKRLWSAVRDEADKDALFVVEGKFSPALMKRILHNG